MLFGTSKLPDSSAYRNSGCWISLNAIFDIWFIDSATGLSEAKSDLWKYKTNEPNNNEWIVYNKLEV